ncbi:MAG: cadherin-like domain-containing protein, partial [Campylobacterota bacterium]|nr:cadherin-like domain-containing protein [Campylobacterota bacterium]
SFDSELSNATIGLDSMYNRYDSNHDASVSWKAYDADGNEVATGSIKQDTANVDGDSNVASNTISVDAPFSKIEIFSEAASGANANFTVSYIEADAAVTLSTDEDSSITVDVLANDSDSDGGTLSIANVEAPVDANGDVLGTVEVVTVDGKDQIKFTPNETAQAMNDGESADVSIKYTISDGQGGTDTASVTVNVIGSDEVDNTASAPTLDMSVGDAREIQGEAETTFSANGDKNFNNNSHSDTTTVEHGKGKNKWTSEEDTGTDSTVEYKNVNHSSIDMKSGDDTVTVSSNANNAKFNMGDGDDTVYIAGNAQDVTINTDDSGWFASAGNDTVAIDGQMQSATINTGGGDDYVQLGDVKNATINLGSGDDVLKLAGSKSDYGIVEEGNGVVKIVTGDFTRHDNGDSQWIEGGDWTTVTGAEAIVFGDGTYIGDEALASQYTNAGSSTYEYSIALNSGLTDTDGSETLSAITVSNLPTGATLSGTGVVDNNDGTYSVATDANGDATATLTSSTEIADADLNSISGSVTSTESDGGDTATTTQSANIEVNGTAGDDTLSGTDANEVIDAGAGDDTIVFDAKDTIDGGAGYDTLVINEEMELDFASVAENMENMEALNLNDGAQDLTIALEDVVSLSDSAGENVEITIEGDDADKVNLNEQEFTLDSTSQDNGTEYDVYVNTDSTVTLNIDNQIEVDSY